MNLLKAEPLNWKRALVTLSSNVGSVCYKLIECYFVQLKNYHFVVIPLSLGGLVIKTRAFYEQINSNVSLLTLPMIF